MTSLSKADIKEKAGTLQNIPAVELSDQLKQLYSTQSYIPALIEDMEGMKEHSLKDYYVKLKTVIQEEEDINEKIDVGFDKIGGQKININIEDLFDKIKGLGQASKILIVGGAGVGKSTLMQYMAYKWSQDQLWENKFDLVYRVTLKTLLSNSWKQQYYSNKIYSSEIDKKPLKYIIHHNIQRVTDPDQIKQIRPEDIQFTQNCLILLDGYDEITHLQDDLTYQALQAEIFEQNYVILTSRPNAVDSYFKAKFNRIIENVGLDNEGMDQFINLWFQEEGKEEVKRQKQKAQSLLSNSQIRSICYIPVNLAMLCYLCSQKSGSQKEVKVFNSCQLYQQVVLKLGERFISKDFRGALQEGQSLQEKIQIKLANLPEIKVLQHIAYMGLTGGGVENQNYKKKQLLIIKTYSGNKDNWGISIQNSIKTLNAEVNVERLVKFGLLKQEGNNHKNKEYCFIHLSFQEYLAAEYLIEKIISGTEVEYKNVIKYISIHRNEPKLLLTLKFMCGILTQSDHLEALQDFWNSMSCNVEGLLEFTIEGRIRLLANMLGQAYRKDKQDNLILDERIPNLQQIVDIVNMVIIQDIKQFKELLKDSHYVSEQIQNVIQGFLRGEDRRLEVVQLIYESYFPSNKQQELTQIIKENKDSCIKQVIGYIFKQFQKEQQQNSSNEQFENGITKISQTPQSINKTQLMQTGLDLVLYIPQKIQTEYFEDSIVQLLEMKEDWQIQKFALFSYGQIFQAIKQDSSLLHQKILNFILQLDLAIENATSKDQQYSSSDQNLLDTVFGVVNHVIELDADRVYSQIAKIFNYCFYYQQDTLLVLLDSIKQNIQNSKVKKKKDANKFIILSADFAVQVMNQIIGSGNFINEKQKFLTIFNVIPVLLSLFNNEKQKQIYIDKAIDLFYELLNEQTINNQIIQLINSIIILQTNSETKKKTNLNVLLLLCKILKSGQCSLSQDLIDLSIFLLNLEMDGILKQQAAEDIVDQLVKSLEEGTLKFSNSLFEDLSNFLSVKLNNQTKIISTLLNYFISTSQKEKDKQLFIELTNFIYYQIENLEDKDFEDITKKILENIFKEKILFSQEWICSQIFGVMDDIIERIRDMSIKINISKMIFGKIIESLNDLEDKPFHLSMSGLYQIFDLIINKDLQQQYLKLITKFQLAKYKSKKEYVHFQEIESFILLITDKQESLNMLTSILEHDAAYYKQNMLNDFSQSSNLQTIVKVDKSEMDKPISHISKILMEMICSNDLKLQEILEQDIENLLKSHDEGNNFEYKIRQIIIWMNTNCFQQQTSSQISQKEIQIGLFELLISLSKVEIAIINNIFKNLINFIESELIGELGIQKQSNSNRISLIFSLFNVLLKEGESIKIDEDTATQYFNQTFQIMESQEDIEVSKLIYESIPQIQKIMNDSQLVQEYIQNFFEFLSKQIQYVQKDFSTINYYISILQQLINLMDSKIRQKFQEKSICLQLEQYKIVNINDESNYSELYNSFMNAIMIYSNYYPDCNFLQQILQQKLLPQIENDDQLFTKKGLLAVRTVLFKLDYEIIKKSNLVNRLKTFISTEKLYLKDSPFIMVFLDRILNAFFQIDFSQNSNFVFLHLQNLLETLSQDHVEVQNIEDFKYYMNKFLNLTDLCIAIQLGLKKIISQLSSQNLEENKAFQTIHNLIKMCILKLLKSGKQIKINAVILESDMNQILQTNTKSIEHLKKIQPLLFMVILAEGQDHYSSIVKQLIENCLNADENQLLDSDLHEYFEDFSLILQHLTYSEQKNSLENWMINLLLKSMKYGHNYQRTFILKQISILLQIEKSYLQWSNISIQTISYIRDHLQEADTLIKAIHITFISQKNVPPETQQQIMNLAFKSKQKLLIQKVEQFYLEKISQIKQNYTKIQKFLKIQEMTTLSEVIQEISLIIYNQIYMQELNNEFCLEQDQINTFNELVLKFQVLIHEQPVNQRDKNKILNQQHQISRDGLKLLKVFDLLNQICQFLQMQMDQVYKKHFYLSSYEFIIVILNIISFENEETSDRKELIKECKSLLNTNLKFMNQEGINWILSNISQISVLSHLSKMVVLKVCDSIFEDGIISDNSDKKDGINEFRVLIEIIRSKANVILNDKNQLNVEGKTYNLNLSQHDQIILDKEISLMIQNSGNPLILQYAKYNPLFKNNNLLFQSSLDKKTCSIIDMNCINSNIKDVKIDSLWRLVELKAHNGNKIIFFEKRNIFGRRIVSLIDFEKQSVKQIFDSNRMHIFGQYQGPMMFYSKITKKKYPKQSADEKYQENLSNSINNHIDWRYISKEQDFIQCYNYFCQNRELTISSPTFVIYHDALLRLEVTSDRMQDIVYFEFMKTIKDQKESLKHELNSLSIRIEQQQSLLEYFDGFVKTFNLTYTEASIIVSGKFEYDQGSTSVTILSKIASCLPFIGDVASSTIESVGEFINNIEIKRNAKAILKFAIDHSDLSQQACLISKQIIITNHIKLIENNFQVGYMDMFNAKQDNQQQKKAFLKKFAEKILGKIEDLNQYIESNLYGNLYEGKYAQLGNSDASQFIEIYCGKNSTEKIDKIYKEIQYFRKQINSQKIEKQPEEINKSSCSCSIF